MVTLWSAAASETTALAGLSAGYHAQQKNLEYELYEADARVGLIYGLHRLRSLDGRRVLRAGRRHLAVACVQYLCRRGST